MSAVVLVDTSAVLALRNPLDRSHADAIDAFERLQAREAPLLTTSYLLVETYALLQRRLGPAAVRSFRSDFAPLLEVAWIDAEIHEEGLDAVQEAGRRGPSLADATAFVVARRRGIRQAFAFDPHFVAAGLRPV